MGIGSIIKKVAKTAAKVVPGISDIVDVASLGLDVAGVIIGSKATKKANETEEEYAARVAAQEEEANKRFQDQSRISAKTLRRAADFSKLGTELDLLRLDRDIYRTEGTIKAQVAHAGLLEKGSAWDILQDSARQGALEKQLVALQGQSEYESLMGQAEATEVGAGITFEEPDAPPTPEFLQETYQLLLGRDFNQATDSYWLTSGDTAESAFTNIARIATSAPTEASLSEMYNRLLGREWNPETDAFWLTSGDTMRTAEQNIRRVVAQENPSRGLGVSLGLGG